VLFMLMNARTYINTGRLKDHDGAGRVAVECPLNAPRSTRAIALGVLLLECTCVIYRSSIVRSRVLFMLMDA
jgi:hypothetical protein